MEKMLNIVLRLIICVGIPQNIIYLYPLLRFLIANIIIIDLRITSFNLFFYVIHHFLIFRFSILYMRFLNYNYNNMDIRVLSLL